MISTLKAAEMLGVTPMRVRNLIYDGVLPARKIGRSWVLREEDVMQRLSQHPRSGRPRKAVKAPIGGNVATSPAEAHTSTASGRPQPTLHDLFVACKKELASSPSVAEVADIEDPEEAAFRIAVADFFLQRRQSELVRQGVY